MSEIFICRREAVIPENPYPTFTYTGVSNMIDDGDGNWRIKLLTSGTLTFTEVKDYIDVFLVGGGASGTSSKNDYHYFPGSGGGGGYTITSKGMQVETNKPYDIVIGAGGIAPPAAAGYQNSTGRSGGNTTAFSLTANGGQGGYAKQNSPDVSYGGSGGSGGGVWGGAGGTNGGNGKTGGGGGIVGYGQGTTTREFGEPNGDLYAAGGSSNNNSRTIYPNTGNGGNGPSTDLTCRQGGDGSSGIVVIRNMR